MKLTLLEVRKVHKGLDMISGIDITDRKTTYRIARNIRKIEPDIKAIEVNRVQIARKHGATQTEPVPEANLEAYQNEYDDFLSGEVEIDLQEITEEMLTGFPIKSIAIALLGDVYVPTPEPIKPVKPVKKEKIV